MTDILDMLRDVPPSLLVGWGGWLAAGAALVTWQVKARASEQEQAYLAVEARRARAKSGVRPPAGVRTAARPARTTPVDAFGELEAMLEPEPTTGSLSRRPGD
jgi:hypothetical protein